jgi:hypothetical protein
MEFYHTKIQLSLINSTIATLTRPVKSGGLNFALVQRPQVRARFHHLLKCVKTQLRVFAGAARGQQKWKEADVALGELERAWIEFLDEAVVVVDGCSDPDAAFGLRSTSAFLYLVGSRTRSLYIALAGAVRLKDPEADSIAIKRVEITPGWLSSAEAFRNPSKTRQAALEAMQKAAQHVDNEFLTTLGFRKKDKSTSKSSRMSNNEEEKPSPTQKSFLTLSAAVHATRQRRPPNRRKKQRGPLNIPLSVIFGVQYGVALGIAVALCVVPVIYNKGFHQRPTDVALTVVVTWSCNIGSAHNRALNRIVGTFMGAVWSYLVLALAFAATGGNWDNNNPGKFIIAGFWASFWAGFCIANMLRYPAKAYAWIVAGLTVPFVTLTLMRTGTSPPWEIVGWRVINVLIGVAIVWLVSLLVLPLSARTVVNSNFSAALHSMAELLRQLPVHLTAAADNPNSTDGVGVSALSTAGSVSPQAFLTPIIAGAPIQLSLRVQRALADVSAAIPVLESEYLPHHRLRRVPKGATGAAVHAAQLMLDFLNITFAIKMEKSHLGPWQIPVLQHTHLTSVAASVAEALDSLRDAILGDIKSIETTLKCLDDVEIGLEKQIEETLAIAVADNNSTADGGSVASEVATAEEAIKKPSQQLRLEVLMLLYMGISVSQQLKILCSATARAFFAQDEAVVAEIDRKVSEKTQKATPNNISDGEDASQSSVSAASVAAVSSSRGLALEHLMARALESTQAEPVASAAAPASSASVAKGGAMPLEEQQQEQE